ncbi:haloacid dehalogenase [bacterium 0.1xD8-71]|nr:haloacid dehalogenase [bacterium 0.1xD8-71]
MKTREDILNVDVHQIDMLVFDFDGVMTDNRVLVDECGIESVFVSRADGMGINMLKEAGFECMILSTEQNAVVGKRAEKLKINVIQGVGNKKEVLRRYVESRGMNLENILYVGNDINDLEAMQIVGISVVPSDAYEIVKKEADVVLETRGGYGVVRELAEYLTADSAKGE